MSEDNVVTSLSRVRRQVAAQKNGRAQITIEAVGTIVLELVQIMHGLAPDQVEEMLLQHRIRAQALRIPLGGRGRLSVAKQRDLAVRNEVVRLLEDALARGASGSK